MRRQRLLRNTSTQSLCLFCAFRLSGQVAPAASSTRRLVHDTGRANQQATAQAVQPQDDAPQTPQWTFDPNSSLSLSEQKWKFENAARREREAAEKAQQRAQEQAKRDLDRQIEELRAQEAAQRWSNQAAEARQSQQRHHAPNGDRQQRQRHANHGQTQQRSVQNANHPQQGRSESPFNVKQVPQRIRNRSKSSRDAHPSQAVSGEEHVPQRQGAKPRPAQTRQRAPVQNVERQQMPTFGVTDQAENAATGWGWGSSQILPPKHKTDEEIAAEKAEEDMRRKERRAREKQEKREVAERRKAEQFERERERERIATEQAEQQRNREQAAVQRKERIGNQQRAPPTRLQQASPDPAYRPPLPHEGGIEASSSQGQAMPFESYRSSPPPPPEYAASPEGSNVPSSPHLQQPPLSRYSASSEGWSQNVPPQFQRRPPPPPPGTRTYPEPQGEYRATPFKASEYQPSSQPSTSDSWTNTWPHLAPRKVEPAPSSSTPPAPPPQQASNARYRPAHVDDTATIDRKFREYQQQRSQAAWANSNIQNTVTSQPADNLSRANRQCARCKEYGHHARECKQPMPCQRCGEKGHDASDCPKSLADAQESKARLRSTNLKQPRNVVRMTQSKPAERPFDSTQERTFRFRRVPDDVSTTRADTRPRRRDDRPEEAVRDVRPSEPAPSQTVGWAEADEEAAEDPAEERRARRSRRGFVDEEVEQPEETAKAKAPERRKDWRASRRRESDEDADDEAFAAREERAARKAAKKAQEKAELDKRKAARAAGERAGGGTQVHLPEFVSVSNLAQLLDVRYEPFVQRLEQLGYDDIFPGKILNRETSGMIAMEYDFDPVYETTGTTGKTEDEERDLKPALEVEDTTFLPTRPPVVTIMGHVDHGKTTILDYLRRTSVAAGEAGGITQHIGAFSVPLASSGRNVTFLDTPGHAAFMSMRQRGANVTDIVILVVAADDSVKPQTLESIRCAREAGVPMIVAVNKVDKPEADVQRVKNDLSRHGVEIEDFGGDVQVVEVSGKTGQGLDALEENVVTLSEILDHRSDTEGAVEGWVLEATTKRAGRVATVLVRRGTLRPGAVLVAGNTWARVRTLRDERDQNVMEVGPGMPVEVDGWRDQPNAGDEVIQAPGEQKATDVIAYRLEKSDRVKMEEDMEAINEARRTEQDRRKAAEKAARVAAAASGENGEDGDAATTISPVNLDAQEDQSTGQQTVPFIIKADVSGSAEAVAAYIPSLTSPLIAPSILASTVGAINESDIELASASGGHIVAFNLPKNEDMRGLAESKGVQVLENNIIYRVLEQVKEVLEARLPAVVTQKVVGEADIGQVFEIGVGGRKKLKIAGCKVRNGSVSRGARVRVVRGGEKVYDGTINSLKNVKKDVQEMRKGTECGMGFDGWEGFLEGDQIQTYEETSEKRKL